MKNILYCITYIVLNTYIYIYYCFIHTHTLLYICIYIYRYYSWSTYVEGTVKPSLHRLTGAAAASGSLTYYQATGITYI